MNTWQLTQQTATLPTARHHADDWTSRDDALLIQLRQHNISLADCATRLGRTYYAVSTRSQLLGLAQPRTIRSNAAPAACPECWMVHAAECR